MTEKARTRSKPILDRLAEWLAGRSRLIRSIIAALVALAVTGAITILLYSFLMGLPPGSFEIGAITTTNIVTFALIVLTIIGVALYWLGWRVLIGLDLRQDPVRPGRAAAAWVLFGIVVFVATLILILIYTLNVVTSG